MGAVEDLKAALNDLAAEAVGDLEALIARLGSTPPDNTAAIQALTQQAKDTTAKLKQDMANLTGSPVVTPSGAAVPTS